MSIHPAPNHPRKAFFQLSLPNILSNLTVPLAGIIDTALLGHLEDITPLAGVALGSILFDYIFWMFGFLRMSTTGLTAQALGSKQDDELVLVPSRALMSAILIGVFILILQIPLGDIGFWVLQGTDEVKQHGLLYYQARIWGAPVALANFVLTGWLLGRGKGRWILTLSILGNGTNIALDYLLIYVYPLGAWGAGFATMISQYTMFGLGIYLFIKETRGGFRFLTIKNLFNRQKQIALLKLNGDIFIRTFLLITSFSYFLSASSGMGTLILAANSILQKVISLAAYFIDGLAFAVESLAGRFKGEKNQAALDDVTRVALLTAAITGLVFATGFHLFPNLGFSLFTDQVQILDLLQRYSAWLYPVMFFGSAAYIWDGIYLGLSEGKILRNCMIFSTCLGFLPLAIWASHIGNVHLLWFSLALFMVFRGVSLWWFRGRLLA